MGRDVPGAATAARDVLAGVVLAFVAFPLCVGIAIASGAPPQAGLISGVVGGVLVGLFSGSHTAVSGPAAGMVAVVALQITRLGSFEAFLLALSFAGVMQVAFGLVRVGSLAGYFPISVVRGLLAAFGVILVLKQIPHLLGADNDPEGEMSFLQPDRETTFSEIARLFESPPVAGPAVVGVLSLVVLYAWRRLPILGRSAVPAPLFVIALGIALTELFRHVRGWEIAPTHLVRVPVRELSALVTTPDFSLAWSGPVWVAAIVLAAAATLETLVYLEAVDKLDPLQRPTPSNRELMAQGAGNVACGLLGGLPLTLLIVRSAVNVDAGGRTRLATITHGVILLGSLALVPGVVSRVPYAAVAAVLIHTGLSLTSVRVIRRMWAGGTGQFVPFVVTGLAIFFTDVLVGIVVGLAAALVFILRANIRRPIRRTVERHPGGDVTRIELASQESFLNRASLHRVLESIPPGAHVLFDGRATEVIDADILELVQDFAENVGPKRGVRVSLLGFRGEFGLEDRTEYVDTATREVQSALTPAAVLDLLRAGHERFLSRRTLTRDLRRQLHATAGGQHPVAAVLGCIDSRVPAELIFDLGVGDIFSARVAGNVVSPQLLASLEYACAVAGAKLVLVMGHTHCGAVTAAIDLYKAPVSGPDATGCQHIDEVLSDIQAVLDSPTLTEDYSTLEGEARIAYVTRVAKLNVLRTAARLTAESQTLARLAASGQILVVGAIYDIAKGAVEFLPETLPVTADRA